MLLIDKLKIFIRANYLIILILILAFILRIWGVAYGWPGLFVGDEKSLVGGALKMIYERNIFPVLEPDAFRLLYYPVLIPWILLKVGAFRSLSTCSPFKNLTCLSGTLGRSILSGAITS